MAPVLDYRRTFLEPETDWAAQSFNAQSIQKACSDDLSLRARYQEFGEMLAIGSTRYETVRLLDLQDWQKLYVERQRILAQRLRKAESHSQHITVSAIQAANESLNSFEPDDLLKFVYHYNSDIFRWRQALRSG